MKRVDSDGHLNGKFSNGDPLNGIEPTVIEASWLNTIQEELCHVIENAGMALDKNDTTQLLEAISWHIKRGEFKKIMELADTLIITQTTEPTTIIESSFETDKKFLEFNYSIQYQNFQAQTMTISLMIDGKIIDKKANIMINANEQSEYRFKDTYKLNKPSGKYTVALLIQPMASKINIFDSFLIIKEV